MRAETEAENENMEKSHLLAYSIADIQFSFLYSPGSSIQEWTATHSELGISTSIAS